MRIAGSPRGGCRAVLACDRRGRAPGGRRNSGL